MADNPYADLRFRALEAADLGLTPRSDDHPDVVGLVIDIPAEDGFATLVALADGATSLYTSTGGGMIGAGEHEHVAETTTALLVEVQRSLDRFTPNETTDHPASDFVRFSVLTDDGRVAADLPVGYFWEPDQGPIPSVVSAAQGVVTAMRQQGST